MKIKKISCILLAMLMIFGTALSVLAEPSVVTMYISDIWVELDTPVAGAKPDMTPQLGQNTVGCEIAIIGDNNGVMWYNLTDEVDVTADDVLEEGKTYQVIFHVGALDYYEFKNHSEMNAYVNNELLGSNSIGGIHGYDESKFAHIAIEVTPVAEHDIAITNGVAKNEAGDIITSAVAGETVTIEAVDPSGIREFNWWNYYGDAVEFADDEALTTTFVMPAYDVVIDAFFSNILVEEANFSVNGYFVGEDSASLIIAATSGIEILPIDGYAANCVLLADDNGSPADVAVEGPISANTHYWLGIRFRAAEAYDICELMPENVKLTGSLDKLFATNEDYENLEAFVFFKLPKATRKPVTSEIEIIDSVVIDEITIPEKNASPDREVIIPADANYSMYEVIWKRLESTETSFDYSILQSNATFEEGYDYQIDIVLQANEGFEFAVNEDGNPIVTSALNGEPAMPGVAYENQSAKEFIVVSYVFSIEKTVVDTVVNFVTVTVETAAIIEIYENIEVVFISVADSKTYTYDVVLKTTDDGKTTLDDGKTTLDDGKTTLDDGKTTLDDGKTTLDDGKTTLDDGKTTLDFYLKTTDGFLKTTDIPEGEYIVKTTKPGYVAEDFKTTLKTTEPANLKTTLHMYGDPNNNGKIDMTDYILLKRAYFGTYNFKTTEVLRSDLNRNGKIDMTDYILLKRAYFGTFKTTDIGKTTLDEGKTTLDDGKTTLDEGKTTLDDGKTTLDDGKTTLDDGKTTLDDGKTTLDDGKTTLDTGKTTLDTGKTTLDNNKTT